MVSGFTAGGARAVARCDVLGVPPYSDTVEGLYRGYLTPAYAAAQAQVSEWMAEAGMAVRRDAAANLIGAYEGLGPDAPALLIGSHIDSVRDAGRYDGPLGIMLGIEAVSALNEAGRRLPFPIEVYAFGDEEGSRFPSAMLTSRAVAGTLDPALLDVADAEGVTLARAFANFGADTFAGPTKMVEARHAPALAYVEAHIEQGPLLEAEGLAVGTVTGIAAQRRYRIEVTGTAGHAGTTSMPLRRDALTGAAEMVLAVEAVARAADLVATVGQIDAQPGAANVIPGVVRFTIDIRASEAAARDAASEAVLSRIAAIADYRHLTVAVERIHDLPASPCDPALMDLLDAATATAGQPLRRLVSGAGHDAMVMAALCPTAMLFVRCRGGISHNPAEHVERDDAAIALEVMCGFIDRLGALHAA